MSVRPATQRSRRVPALLLLVGALLPGLAAAGDTQGDRWWAVDKAAHFGASAAIAGGVYVISVAVELDRGDALLIAGSASLAAGVGKELLDATMGDSHFSWKDLVWDGIGVAVGLLLAWGIDLAVRGIAPEGPELFRF